MSRLSLVPQRCVVLGIDPGATSGAAVIESFTGRLVLAYDIATEDADGLGEAVGEAVERSEHYGFPLVVVAEDWPSGAFPNETAYGSVREAWGRWRHALDVGAMSAPIVRVHASTWRAGLGLKARGRDAWKAAAVTAVRARFGKTLPADAAEAVCIAVWGAHSSEVGEALR